MKKSSMKESVMLVVDDEQPIRWALGGALRGYNYARAAHADTGDERGSRRQLRPWHGLCTKKVARPLGGETHASGGSIGRDIMRC